MTRHLIVTCGTSHLDDGRLVKLDLHPDRDPFYTGLRDDPNPILDGHSERLLGDPKLQVMLEALIPYWPMLEQYIGRDDNPFGAEICTLEKMRAAGEYRPPQDALTLLHSDTEAGAFCAALLRRLLQDPRTWQVPPGRVHFKRVALLREKPSEPGKAEANLALAFEEVCREKSTTGIVMTGGFKSIVPLATLFALLHDLDLHYLFERSDQLCTLDLPVELGRNGEWWAQVRARLSGKRLALWVRVVLDLPDRPIVPF